MFLSLPFALLSRHIPDVPLDIVQSLDRRQRLSRNVALVARMQTEELASGMDHATDLGDAACEAGHVTTEVIAHQFFQSSHRGTPGHALRLGPG